MPPKKINFTIDALKEKWTTYPWNLKALLIAKSDIQTSKKGARYMEAFFSDPTGKIRALVFESKMNKIDDYEKYLQVNRIYNIKNAQVKPWTMGEYVNLCELVLPPLSQIEQQPINEMQNSKKRKSVPSSDSEEPGKYSRQENNNNSSYKEHSYSSRKVEENGPSTSYATEEKTEIEEKVFYVQEINSTQFGFAVCIDKNCRQKMVPIKKIKELMCPECEEPTTDYDWNIILEIVATDGENKTPFTCTGKAAEKLLGQPSTSIAVLHAIEDKTGLEELANAAKGKMFIITHQKKTNGEGSSISDKITDITENVDENQMYSLLSKSLKTQNELINENHRMRQTIEERSSSDSHKRNDDEQEKLRRQQKTG